MTEPDERDPESIRDLWAALKAEVIWLHGRWIIYRQLYGTSPDRVDVLNASASTFFQMLNQILLRHAMNCIEFHYTHAQTRYELFTMVDDGDALLKTLRRGLRYRELVREGLIDRGDLRRQLRQKA